MKVKTLDSKLIDLLEEKYGSLWWPTDMYPEDSSSDPFKHLIITILSQNTSEANCIGAYKGLAARFEIKPEALANGEEKEIRDSIRSVHACIDFIAEERRDRASGLLWLLVRHTCRALNPKCYECLLAHLCEYERGTRGL